MQLQMEYMCFQAETGEIQRFTHDMFVALSYNNQTRKQQSAKLQLYIYSYEAIQSHTTYRFISKALILFYLHFIYSRIMLNNNF